MVRVLASRTLGPEFYCTVDHYKKLFFQSLLSYRMRNRPTLTTVLRRVGEFNTSLIAHLKLPKKSIIQDRYTKKTKKKPVSNPQLGPLPGRVIILSEVNTHARMRLIKRFCSCQYSKASVHISRTDLTLC